AYAHQDLPFEKLVAELKPVRDLSRNPLFQVMFLMQNTQTFNTPFHLSGLELVDAEVKGAAANFDLTLGLAEVKGRLHVEIEYAHELFDYVRIERLTGHYRRILEGMVGDVGQGVWAVKMLSAAEEEQVVGEWNGKRVEHGSGESLQELFEQQAEQRP